MLGFAVVAGGVEGAEGALAVVVVVRRGCAIGVMLGPNWASRNMKRRERRVEGEVVAWGWGVEGEGGGGLWEWLREDSGGWKVSFLCLVRRRGTLGGR